MIYVSSYSKHEQEVGIHCVSEMYGASILEFL